MLQTLRVRNFGAVDDATIELADGLTVLTGETGAGKTLLIEALHLVLGGKDRSLPIRDPASASRVEAVFAVDGGDEVVLVRELAPQGRLRASIDGASASAQLLAARAEPLCQLHGQHEHLMLRTADAARLVLDRSASIDDGELRELRGARAALLAQRERLGGSGDERSRRLDLLAHDVAEIDAVAPEGPGELDALLVEVGVVAGVLDSKEALAHAVAALDADGDGVSASQLMSAALVALPRQMDVRRAELGGLVEEVRTFAAGLRRELEAVDDDPDRLDALNARVSRLQALVRKHGHSLGDVVERRTELAAQLDTLRAEVARAETLDEELAALAPKLADAEAGLLGQRRAAGSKLEASMRARLAPLALERATFAVDVDGPAGEKVSFQFAGSDAFSPAPLADAASGGELSRVMLALTLATDAGAATMVFDEVDAGIGGATARDLAACLAEVALDRQVVVVTHLATVAAAATHHVVVERATAPGGPASIRSVEGAERVAEIARMLAGDQEDPVAITHATALLAGDPASS